MTENTTRDGSARARGLRKVFFWSLAGSCCWPRPAMGSGGGSFAIRCTNVTARVTRGDIRRSINMTGALNPVVTAQVGSYVSGNIKSWSCDYNTQVKIGQQCALIDPLPFQVVVDEDEADVRTSKAQLTKDKAATANARVVYERDKKLRDQGIVSQETLDADKSALDQDVATIDLDVATIAGQTGRAARRPGESRLHEHRLARQRYGDHPVHRRRLHGRLEPAELHVVPDRQGHDEHAGGHQRQRGRCRRGT